MKPGHGEVLIAEGDVEVAEEEELLVEEFRRQLEEGMWAAVPERTTAGRREARMVKAFEDDPARRRSRHLLPPRCRRRLSRSSRTTRCCSLPSPSAVVIVALLWDLVLPSLKEAWERHQARRARDPRPAYDPGRERRAEQRARQLLQSCVNDEEWSMYRDLGFIRVWGGMARVPRARAHRRRPAAGAPTPTSSTRTSRSSPTCPRRASCSTSTASSSPTRRGPTAARACPTPTTCWRSGWR